jgi:hypothetical protein
MTSELSDWIRNECEDHLYWSRDTICGYRLGLERGFKKALEMARILETGPLTQQCCGTAIVKALSNFAKEKI